MVEAGGLKPLRIAMILPTVLGDAPEPEVERAVRDAAVRCEQLGHTVEEAALPVDGPTLMHHIEMLWCVFPDQLARNYWLVCFSAQGWQFWKWPRYEEAIELWTRGLAKHFRDNERKNPGQVKRAVAYLEQATATYARFFEKYDLILGPVQRKAVHPLGVLDTSRPFYELKDVVIKDSGYAGIQNVTGLPAISLPLSETAAGQPLGVMFTAPDMGEERLLKLSYALEEAAPWSHRWPSV